jgi:hypothetical protein
MTPGLPGTAGREGEVYELGLPGIVATSAARHVLPDALSLCCPWELPPSLCGPQNWSDTTSRTLVVPHTFIYSLNNMLGIPCT